MRKLVKLLSVVLAVAFVATIACVSVFAAEPASIAVKTAPDRTVYYEDVDTNEFDGTDAEGYIFCDTTGMVITVTNSDGTTFDVSGDSDDIEVWVEGYVIGENEATVYYLTENGDELTTTLPVTVEKNPVASVKITKMPAKTEYDMDKDVLTKDNFSFDKLYQTDPETFDAIFGELGMSYEDIKEIYNNPTVMNMLKEIIFSEYESILLVDTTGMEIVVTYKDGTTQTLTDEDDCAVYNGAEIPVMVGQASPKVVEGKNTLYVEVAGVKADFEVTVKKAQATENKPATDKPSTDKPATEKPAPSDPKNPVIPDTDGGVSVTALAVIALASACSIALIPSKKEK